MAPFNGRTSIVYCQNTASLALAALVLPTKSQHREGPQLDLVHFQCRGAGTLLRPEADKRCEQNVMSFEPPVICPSVSS